MRNARINLTPFFNLKCLHLHHNLKGYIGLYHRFKALLKGIVCCEQTCKLSNKIPANDIELIAHHPRCIADGPVNHV